MIRRTAPTMRPSDASKITAASWPSGNFSLMRNGAPDQSPTDRIDRTTLTSRRQEAAGERRYLTVMFCDLVDSTGIAAQLDGEEWRDLVNAYLDDASTAVIEMDGHVAKKLGDGLMAR
jgi:class 3 adenylate cyclase